MRAFCISLPETPARREIARAHFVERGARVEFFDGVHALNFGLTTTHTYDVDHPGTGYRITSKHVGCWLSHYILWQALTLADGDKFLIFEDDVALPEDWHIRMLAALDDTPENADMLYLGSCCCDGKPKEQISNTVWDVKWPLCTHAYVVWKKALPRLLATQRKCWAPIDLALYFNSLPHLKVYTVLPRIADQRDMNLPL